MISDSRDEVLAVTAGAGLPEVPSCPITQEQYSSDGALCPLALPCGHSVSRAALRAVRISTPGGSTVVLYTVVTGIGKQRGRQCIP